MQIPHPPRWIRDDSVAAWMESVGTWHGDRGTVGGRGCAGDLILPVDRRRAQQAAPLRESATATQRTVPNEIIASVEAVGCRRNV
jgi:hypothetical protein